MTTPPKTSTKPAKGGWAPGNYMCKCHMCGEEYFGDKRSTICADCEHKDVSPTPPKTPGEAARESFWLGACPMNTWEHMLTPDQERWERIAKAAIDAHYNGPQCKTIVRIEGANGKITSLYLRDGIRVTIGRTAETKGQAWLELRDTPTVDALSQQPLTETDSENSLGVIGEM